MGFEKISFDNLEINSRGKDGLVFFSVGNDVEQWIDGIAEKMFQDKITHTNYPDEIFESIYILETRNGRRDLVFIFNRDYDFDIQKLVMWKLTVGSSAWVSDYISEYYGDH